MGTEDNGQRTEELSVWCLVLCALCEGGLETKHKAQGTFLAFVLCLMSFVLSFGLEAAPSADGANLVFTVKRPGTTQGFIAIFVQ